MARIEESPIATGGPGIEPRWTRSAKDAVGTAYSVSSMVWYTVSDGVVNEVYYPTIDRPQIRDMQFLITDGSSFFHDERRGLITTAEYLSADALGVRMVNREAAGRYQIVKEIIGDPHADCLLVRAKLEGEPDFVRKLRLFVMVAPHLEVGGWGNNGNVAEIAGRMFLTAHKAGTWLALAASVPFIRRSCGYVGTTDGWRDLAENLELDYQFASAPNGNIALTGELDLSRGPEVTIGLAFGSSLHHASTVLFTSLGQPFEDHRTRFLEQWARACKGVAPLERMSGDGGALYRRSHSLLLAHEDKNFPGAMIASLSIPWGETRSDDDLGGYHLVWTRDMVNSVSGLLASGNSDTALRALIYLTCSQQPDGGFPQNFWIDGEPYWSGIQLDEVAFPIMLAWRLARADALRDFDPYPMLINAARYLIVHGPATPQERWEENSGFSPSTLAANIAALTCAANFAQQRGDNPLARFLQEYADFLEAHLEPWTVTKSGALVPGISRYYVRINPTGADDPQPDEDLDSKTILIHNRRPGDRSEFPARDVVDGGFLELVRYGIRKPHDPIIEDSLRVVDAVLKTQLPAGACWHRYNHDGYGQRDDGSAFEGWGVGRPWPLLTGERGHYELAAGRDVMPYIRAIEGFANPAGLLPEQVWDQAERPEYLMYLGGPTGAAMPLMWAHAEYLKLLRSRADRQIFDFLPEVADRYWRKPVQRKPLEVWKYHHRRVAAVAPGITLRIQTGRPFRLHWSADEWQHVTDTTAAATAIAIYYVDIGIAPDQRAPIRFTFFWTATGQWEGKDFAVVIQHPA